MLLRLSHPNIVSFWVTTILIYTDTFRKLKAFTLLLIVLFVFGVFWILFVSMGLKIDVKLQEFALVFIYAVMMRFLAGSIRSDLR